MYVDLWVRFENSFLVLTSPSYIVKEHCYQMIFI